MSEIRIKRGASLNLSLQFSEFGSPIDVTGIVLASQVRDPQDRLVATLPLVKLAQTGLVSVQIADTTQWPIGRLRCDLTAVFDGQVIYSETFPIQVAGSVTRS